MMSEEKDRKDEKKPVKKKIEDIDNTADKKPAPKKRKPRAKKSKPSLKKASERLIQDALEAHLEYQAVRVSGQKRDLMFLSNVIDEYLDNFIILGYDYQGEAVQLISATNQQQSDALGTAVHRFIMNNHNKAGGMGPEIY